MKILVVCQYYYPENFQITPICEQLVKDGYSVTVLTGLPNYPTGVVPEEYKKGHRDEYVNGVHVIRCYEVGRGRGALHLGLNYLSYCLSAMRKTGRLDGDFDLVFVYQLSPVLMGLPGKKYARKHHVPLLLYCCDLWPESLKVYIKSENNPLFRYMRRLSKSLYCACDRVAVQSESFLSYLHQVHDLAPERMLYLPAFADDAYLHQDLSPEDNKTVDFVFLGNLGAAQDLISVLGAVEKIRNVPGFMVHFVGDGSCLPEMKTFAAEHGLEDVVAFYGRRPVEEMTAYYKLADACLLSLKADSQVGYTLPAKTQGYMAAGKPIIGMIDGSAKSVIEQSGCGVCVSAGDVDGLADAMLDFILHREKYKDCGENGRRYFQEHFSKSIFMERLEQEIQKLCEE